MIVKDALAGIYKKEKETITVEEHNKLLKRIQELEYTIKALQSTNLQLAEAIKETNTTTKPPQKDRVSFID